MSQKLVLELSDDIFALLQRRAAALGETLPEYVLTALKRFLSQSSSWQERNQARTEEEKAAARRKFERHIGEVALGVPDSSDNTSIDADLAREYADNHEGL